MAKDVAKLGVPAEYAPGRTWVQTDRSAHEAWGRLILKSPRAAAVMHHLVANMGHQNAVVVAQKTLSAMVGCSLSTLKRALADLERDRWIQSVQIGNTGTVNAYVVNSSVAWGETRDQMPRLSVFHAAIIADAADQSEATLGRTKLRKLPLVVPPEQPLPDGPGEPGAQTLLPGLEPVIEGRRDEDD